MGNNQYIIQARVAVETYYPVDENGDIDWKHPFEENDCIEPVYVVRERTAGDTCYGDLSDYDMRDLDKALKHLKELKGEQ